jgi:hypothetical protein
MNARGRMAGFEPCPIASQAICLAMTVGGQSGEASVGVIASFLTGLMMWCIVQGLGRFDNWRGI